MINWFLGIALPLFYIGGIYSGVDALMRSKHAQSTTAWILGLVFIPFVTVPLYWTLGRRGYTDYVDSQTEFDAETDDMRASTRASISRHCEFILPPETDSGTRSEMVAFERFGDSPFTIHNKVDLLINGENTFEAMFAAIKEAKEYVLIQFYIIHDDKVGQQLHSELISARKRGVAVCFLYDKVGCVALPGQYLNSLEEEGVTIAAFSGGRRALQKFRLNFRNHRKIVVVDGTVSFVGGHNVGDEYLGRDEKIGFWRDTHLRVEGPAALALQLSFLRDWYFATCAVPPNMRSEPRCIADGVPVQIASSGPHDSVESCSLLFAQLIGSAEKRIWIASPYLVPDGTVLGAIQLAAMRGVDVRVLVPRTSDNPLFKFVPYAFIGDIMRAGGRIYFYEKGFMHQKVILIDSDYGVVSTANLDNRSFHLNFEVTCIVRDEPFCQELEDMLTEDLSHATEIKLEDAESRPFIDRLATQATRLLAPIL